MRDLADLTRFVECGGYFFGYTNVWSCLIYNILCFNLVFHFIGKTTNSKTKIGLHYSQL